MKSAIIYSSPVDVQDRSYQSHPIQVGGKTLFIRAIPISDDVSGALDRAGSYAYESETVLNTVPLD